MKDNITLNSIFDLIIKDFNLDNIVGQITQISLGLTNKVYKLTITTSKGVFIVKIIDTKSSRARTIEEYSNIERLKKYFTLAHQIPVVLAKQVNSSTVYQYDTNYVLVYPYKDAQPIGGPIGPVSSSQAFHVGELLGRIHQGQSNQETNLHNIFNRTFEYSYLLDITKLKDLIKQYSNVDKLITIASKSQAAYQKLRANMVYSHGDFQPHNILAIEDKLLIIDWELGGLINPMMEVLIAAITFSGYATAESFKQDAFEQLLNGYYNTGCQLDIDLEDAIWAAFHKCWVNWIAFNMEIGKKSVAIDAYKDLLGLIDKMDDLKSRILEHRINFERDLNLDSSKKHLK